MANIHDVARVAGVSISTVSYALSGKRTVSEDARRRIVDAMRTSSAMFCGSVSVPIATLTPLRI